MTLMVVNTRHIASVTTILLTFAIFYATLMSLSRWSMDQMPHSCLVIMFRLSIQLLCLPVKFNVNIKLSMTIALGKTKQMALSSLWTWIVMIILLTLWPRSAHLTHGPPSRNLLFSGVMCNFSKSELFLRGVKTGLQHPLYLKLKALTRSPSNLTYEIS